MNERDILHMSRFAIITRITRTSALVRNTQTVYTRNHVHTHRQLICPTAASYPPVVFLNLKYKKQRELLNASAHVN